MTIPHMAAAAARRVIDVLLRLDDSPDDGSALRAELQVAAGRLDAIADRLEGYAVTTAEKIARAPLSDSGQGLGPVDGMENPIAPPVEFVDHDGQVQATAMLGLPYQGPPGLIHGGVSAMLLDHALGLSNDLAGRSGLTVSLTLRYHRPLVLNAPMSIAARNVGITGRKLYAEGTITSAGDVCVSAEGLFVSRES